MPMYLARPLSYPLPHTHHPSNPGGHSLAFTMDATDRVVRLLEGHGETLQAILEELRKGPERTRVKVEEPEAFPAAGVAGIGEDEPTEYDSDDDEREEKIKLLVGICHPHSYQT